MPKLILIPTPIGNLEDITLRALRLLKEVRVVYAEDTRTTSVLFKHYQIGTPLRAYHLHNEHAAVAGIVQAINADEMPHALVSDAGTPGISDPGFLLVRACLDAGIEVECLPGPTAFVPALLKAGLPAHNFTFEGFLPPKKGRMKRLESLKEGGRTAILYESPHRLLKCLEQIMEVFGEQHLASVSRELTKTFEETRTGAVRKLIDHYTAHPPKGEIVVAIAPYDEKNLAAAEAAAAEHP